MNVINLHRPTVEEASAHMFVSIDRFRQLQREGVLPRANSSDWSPDGTRRRCIENLRAVKGNRLARSGGAKPAKEAPDQGEGRDLDRGRA
jgi:hypothetical protein